MDPGLLSCSDTDSLTALDVAHRVGLRVFKCDQGDDEISPGVFRNIFVFCYQFAQEFLIDRHLVSALLERDPENLLSLDRIRLVGRIDLDDIIIPFFLGFEDLQCFRLVSRCDDAVRNLSLDHVGRIYIADVGQGNKVAEGRHPVSTSGSGISACQRRQIAQIVYPVDLLFHIAERQTDRCSCRGNVLEGSRRRMARCFL